MKITLGSKTLLSKLQLLGGVIPSKSTLPILESFLFDFSNELLTITASDLESTVSARMEVDSVEQAKIAVPAGMLIEILKAFVDQPLEFDIQENNLIEISSTIGKYSIAYQDGKSYPTTEKIATALSAEILPMALAQAISKTVFATGNDDLRPVMTGVLFQLSPEGTNFVSTDAHKLVKYSRKDVVCQEKIDFIVPKKPLNLLKTILSAVEDKVIIDFNNSNAVFHLGNYTLSCRLIDAKFPNYTAVIPTDNPNVLVINRVQLMNSLKCVSIFSNRMTNQVKLKFIGTELNISAEDIDYSNKADERLTCDFQGPDMTIGFNSRFLIEMLSNLQCEMVTIEMSDPKRAGILKPFSGLADGEAILMLVMPVLIS